MSYMSDPTILPRLQEYLQSNVKEMYIDINAISDILQNKYKEYSKRKRSAFRASVNRAYSILLRKSGVEKIQTDAPVTNNLNSRFDEVDESQNLMNVDHFMNTELTRLYTTSSLKTLDGNELIDISSDDDETIPKVEVILETFDKSPSVNAISSQQTDSSNKKRKLGDTTSVIAMEPNKKKKSTLVTIAKSTCNFKSIAGMDKTLEEVCKMILHMRHPEIYKTVGISPPRGLLLHGPPGSGKTLLAKAVSGELDIPLLKVAAPELVAGVSGESEERIRKLFDQAVCVAPCVLFIDEIDAITPSRQNVQKEMERRIVAQLLSCLDDLNENGHNVLVIGASNRLDSIDPALRRAGRFDREISLGIPDASSRVQILKRMTSNLKLVEGFNFELLASNTPGYVGADLLSLTREAAMVAINRLFRDVQNLKNLTEVTTHKAPAGNGIETVKEVDTNLTNNSQNVQDTDKNPLEEVLSWLHNKISFPEGFLERLFVTMGDFEQALKTVQPSAKREGFATIPDTTWDEIGSLRNIREELQMAIIAPVRHAKEFSALGIKVPAGVLLCGPPGCGKTLLAKAIANEAGINFISVKGPELLNMYVGESERAVRVCFERARNSSPCVIFFDELDALCPKRSDSGEGSASRVVNQMLTEMDGIEGRSGVFLLAASNRPDIIDPAVLRPGRLDKILFVDLPSARDRVDILKAITKNGTVPKLAEDVNLADIGSSERCHGFTGADLAALIREASIVALKEFMLHGNNSGQPVMLTHEHFLAAFMKIKPSVSDKDSRHYEKLRRMYSLKAPVTEVEEMEYS